MTTRDSECPVGHCFRGGICYCIDLGGEGMSHREHCFVRMSDINNQGQWQAELVGCDAGCLPCKDFPFELIADAAPLRPSGLSWLAKPRFLEPLTQNARGEMEDLVGHRAQLTQQRMQWVRAACLYGWGWECLTEDEVPCNCWPGWTEFAGADFTCDGIPIGDFIAHKQGDGFFYAGEWPHTADRMNIKCGRFWDPARKLVSIHSQGTNTILLITAIHGNSCASDWQIKGAGHVLNEPTCYGRFALSEPPNVKTGPYINHVSGCSEYCRGLFDRIYVPSNSSRFTAREGLDPHDLDVHDAVLATVRTPNTFASLDPDNDDDWFNFNQLDHEGAQGNAGLGRYSRTWDGNSLDIFDSRLPVVRSYEASKTRWRNEPASVQLVIAKVWFVLDLLLPHTRMHIKSDQDTWRRQEYIEPHAVARIMVWLGLRVAIDGESVAVYTGGNASRWPTITPEGNSLLIAQEPSKWRRPPPFVEWRGQLNHFSRPSTTTTYKHQVGDANESFLYGRILKKAVRDLGSFHVPGAPVHIDHNPEDRNQQWDGDITFTFASGDSFANCYPDD